MTHSKEMDDQEIQNDHYLIEFVDRAGFKHVSTDEGCQKVTSQCKRLPNSGDFQFRYPELECLELLRLESEHFDLFIPNELLVGERVYPLIEFLLCWEKLYKLQFSHMCDEVKMTSCLIFSILPMYKTRGRVFLTRGE